MRWMIFLVPLLLSAQAIEIATIEGELVPHTWIRLIDSEENVHSVGLYAPEPLSDWPALIRSLWPRPATLRSPDPCESWEEIMITRFSISEQKYDQLLEVLSKQHSCMYQIFSYGGFNCAGLVKLIADEAGIDISVASFRRPFPNPYDIREWQKRIKSAE